MCKDEFLISLSPFVLHNCHTGNRVARVEGPSYTEVEELLENYQFQNSNLDLFSEAGVEPWGDRKVKDATRTPRTTYVFYITHLGACCLSCSLISFHILLLSCCCCLRSARFFPGYDLDKDRGFFDDAADKAQSDFEDQFGNWLPNTEDE